MIIFHLQFFRVCRCMWPMLILMKHVDFAAISGKFADFRVFRGLKATDKCIVDKISTHNLVKNFTRYQITKRYSMNSNVQK